MNAPLQTPLKPMIVPIDSAGILNEDDGLAIYSQHKDAIENDQLKVQFQIGPQVKATLPEFWAALLSHTLERVVMTADNFTSSDEAKKLQSDLDARFSVTYVETDVSSERHAECSRISHRFVGFVEPYHQFVIYTTLALENAHIGRPEQAKKYRAKADNHKAGFVANRGAAYAAG